MLYIQQLKFTLENYYKMQIIQGIAYFITFLSSFSALYSHFFWVVEQLLPELANHKLGKSRKREKENDRETETKQHVVFVRGRASSLPSAKCFAFDQLASGICRRTTLLQLLADICCGYATTTD